MPRVDRFPPAEYIKDVEQHYIRLNEVSPVCDQKFINTTKKKIKKVATEKFQIPTWLNGFSHAKICSDDDEDEKFDDNSI